MQLGLNHKLSKIMFIGPQGPPINIPSDPKGLQLVLEYLKETYGNLPIYVQENGSGSADDGLDDTDRIGYLSSYMQSTLNAIRCIKSKHMQFQHYLGPSVPTFDTSMY